MLILKNVYTGYNNKNIIKDISFSLNLGENLAIIGPNGCGKTTLMRAIAGLITHSGDILLNNVQISKLKPRQIAKNIALLSQVSNIYFAYTIYETVLMGRYIHLKDKFLSKPSQKDKDIVKTYLKMLELWHIKDQHINKISTGQLQRVYLARTLAQEPSLILLDEPANHLDLKHQVQLISHLKKWSNTKNKSVIGVFHDINLAHSLTQNIIIMNNGKVLAKGTAKEVLTNENLQQVYGMDVKKYMKETLNFWN